MRPAELEAAYTQAVYRVDAKPVAIFLRVGEHSPDLGLWLGAQGARSFAFISAANPGSQPLPEAENEDRHRRLVEQVTAAGLPALDGESYAAADGEWRERSLLIAGLAREAAIALAREFGQVALLWGEAGGPVELQFADRANETRMR
ncbi:MAG: hypothetical protein QG573_638 [Acidobacteriota bacterium]|nr:hypothetical protein [Acidobacteriota bacterium]